MSERETPADDIITRAEIVEQIAVRRAGRLTDAALAAWALGRFYAFELEEADMEDGAEEMIEEALDALMFGDEPAFTLSDAELKALADRLSGA